MRTVVAAAALLFLFRPASANPGGTNDMKPDGALAALKPYSVTLSVADLDKAAAWYSTKLGFKEVKRKSYPEFGTALVFLERNGWRVELIKDDRSKPGPTRADPPAHTGVRGVSQFAFQTADLAAVKSELLDEGVPIAWEFENKELGAKFLFVRDPEGNLIQFVQAL